MSYWRGWRGTQIIFIPRTSRLNIFLQAEDGIRNHCVTGVQSVLFRSQAEDGIRRSLCDWSSDVCSSDRKSTRLNSSHTVISYAVFCLKKKKSKFEVHTPSAICGSSRCKAISSRSSFNPPHPSTLYRMT